MGAVDTSFAGGRGGADEGGRVGQSGAQGVEAEAEAKQSTFAEVFKAEWTEVRTRRRKANDFWGAADSKAGGGGGGDSSDSDSDMPPQNLAGLALSGGGIRSATFCLGLLQGLNRLGVLRKFDYLSTVSGGGYTGGWWSAWLARTEGGSDDPDNRQRLDYYDDWIDPPPTERKKSKAFPPRENLAQVTESLAELHSEERGDIRARRGSQEEGGADGRGAYEEQQRDCARKSHIGTESWRDRASAGNDPVHHLRLFGNYLTPRKGALSADTWRAVTVIGRNLVLTWLVLLPLLVAVILAAQLYFLAQPAVHNTAELFYTAPWGPGTERQQLSAVLLPRLWLVIWAALGFALVSSVLTSLWMVYSGPAGTFRRLLAGSSGAVGVFLIIGAIVLIALRWSDEGPPLSPRPTLLGWGSWIVVLLGLLGYVFYKSADVGTAGRGLQRWDRLKLWLWQGFKREGRMREVTRGNIVRMHAMVLVALTCTTLALLFAGFGHELVNFLGSGVGVKAWVMKAGGWATVLAAVGGALYTALKTAPSGGRDPREASRPSLVGRVALAVTPPLVLLVLGVGAAWAINFFFVNFALKYVKADDPAVASLLNSVTCVGITLMLYFALAEMAWRGEIPPPPGREDGGKKPRQHKVLAVMILLLAGGAVVQLAFSGYDVWDKQNSKAGVAGGWPHWFFVWAGLFTCALFTLMWWRFRKGGNIKSMALLAGAAAMLLIYLVGGLFGLGFVTGDAGRALLIQTVLGLIGSLLAWVIAFGWMADPNALSMHLFYKGRLVRAYIGASNLARGASLKDVSESVDGDDVLLTQLRNCQRGAPYHLVNTTLNLVGARDLGTAQRSSDYFVLSKLYCGSARTGYRLTQEYMNGTLSLGTAVAVSGAAASPSMGSMTFSAPLVMLMTLLNVRLGYWAPTPNKAGWRETSARFWPYYILRELFSQTNELSAYCNLSDGGHFDNTGLYSLVARGCRLIVLADCGADPRPSFSDLGTAIRRCRIDFNADIQIDIKMLERAAADERPGAAYAIGDIVYDKRHLRALLQPPPPPPAGATDAEKGEYAIRYETWERERDRRVEDESKNPGRIYVVKPGLTGTRDESADVRQYGMMNGGFPQQSTADFWYDEAQFESYRRLGEHCARVVSGPVSSFGKAAEVNLTTIEFLIAP